MTNFIIPLLFNTIVFADMEQDVTFIDEILSQAPEGRDSQAGPVRRRGRGRGRGRVPPRASTPEAVDDASSPPPPSQEKTSVAQTVSKLNNINFSCSITTHLSIHRLPGQR